MVRRHRFLLPVLPLLAACGGGGDGRNADTSEIAGLWDASGVRGGAGGSADDERYVDISDNGLYTLYDYRLDGASDEGNCYRITRRRMTLTGAEALLVDFDPQQDSASGAEVEVTATAFRLNDGRRLVVFPLTSEELYVESDDLGTGFMDRVTGLSAEDLEPCEG